MSAYKLLNRLVLSALWLLLVQVLDDVLGINHLSTRAICSIIETRNHKQRQIAQLNLR